MGAYCVRNRYVEIGEPKCGLIPESFLVWLESLPKKVSTCAEMSVPKMSNVLHSAMYIRGCHTFATKIYRLIQFLEYLRTLS